MGVIYTTKSGRQYTWHYDPPRRKHRGSSKITIDARVPVDLTLETENGLHRLAKAVGFATEFQTLDPNFDRRIYIASDSQAVWNRLRNESRLRQHILQIFGQDVKSVTVNSKKLEVELANVYATLDAATGDIIVDALYGIVDSLSALSPGELRSGLSRKPLAYVVAALCGGALAGGIGAMIAMPNKIVDGWALFEYAVPYALAAVVAVFLLLRLVFSRSSYGHIALSWFLFLGIPGLCMSTASAVYYVNYHYDSSDAETHTLRVLGKYSTRHKNSTSYHVKITDWRDASKSYSLTVTHSEFQTVREGDRVRLYTHPGHLGLEWIESFTL